VGIATYVYLLFGTPAEDESDARQTVRFVGEHHRAITFVNLAIFNMPLDSPEAREVEREPFSGDDLALYTGFRHPRGWDRRRVRRFLDREFRRQPQIAAIIRRDPPHFTSNHAPLLVMHGLDGAE
ncbi:MAG: radical SAM protein, partial [Desulfofustis sp.]|nr:radical SAM protein [Desulfofustis sp.]